MENLDNQSLPLSWSSDFLWNRSFQLRWDLSDMMSLIAQLNYNYDRNQLGRKKDAVDFTAEDYMRHPHVLGLGIFAQARF